MATIPATKLRKGMLFKVQNDLFRALEVNHVTPGNLRGFVRVKARNIRSGMLADNKLRSEDMVERATLDERAMQFMYSDGTDYYFMDNESFEQVHIPGDALGESVNYLLPEMVISVEFYGSEPVGIELPVNYGSRYRDGLRSVYADLAATRKLALVPFLLEGVAMDPGLMQDDGLHPVAAAEPTVLETVWKELRPLLEPPHPNRS